MLLHPYPDEMVTYTNHFCLDLPVSDLTNSMTLNRLASRKVTSVSSCRPLPRHITSGLTGWDSVTWRDLGKSPSHPVRSPVLVINRVRMARWLKHLRDNYWVPGCLIRSLGDHGNHQHLASLLGKACRVSRKWHAMLVAFAFVRLPLVGKLFFRCFPPFLCSHANVWCLQLSPCLHRS